MQKTLIKINATAADRLTVAEGFATSGCGGEKRLAVKTLLAALLAPILMLATPAASVGSVTISGVQKQVQTDQIQYVGTYPQFVGIQDRDNQIILNNRMREWQNCAMARAKAAVLTLQNGDGPKRVVEAVYGYEVKRNSGGLVSLLFSDYLYAGGANGIDKKTGLTVSSITGEEFTLSSLFASDASYTEVLNRIIEEQLKSRGLEAQLLAPFEGLTGKEVFYLTDHELVIVVNELDWFPHAMGTVEFSIPLSDIHMYLKEGILF